VELARRGSRYWDPLATFGYVAARTSRIRFATHVLVLGYHHPLEIAKRYGTLDMVSNGRLILGLGVGSLKEEFDLIGAPYDQRGARADDALRALRACLSQTEPAYHGEFYDFEGFIVDPCAVQEQVPLWVGGRSLRSLRRAAALADGWCPFAVSPAQATAWLQAVERPRDFEVVLPPTASLNPIGEPDRTQEILAETAAHGATIVLCGFPHQSIEEYLDKVEALAAVHSAMATP
jgi:probable F420-dependent oxidoreductase